MFNKIIFGSRNFLNGLKNLFRGRLVNHKDLISELNCLNERLESKWNKELTIGFQKIINEQNKIFLQLGSHADQIVSYTKQLGSHADQVADLHKNTVERFQRSESRLNFLHDLLRQHVILGSGCKDGFEKNLRCELIEALLSEFVDNFDPFCGATIEAIQKEISSALAFYRQNFDQRVDNFIKNLPMTNLNRLYSQLADIESKKLLVKLMSYRLLGLTKVRLRSATDTEKDRIFYANLQNLVSVEFPSFRSGSFEVPCYDLRQIGLNFQCYTIPFAINTEFRNRQYSNAHVHVRAGDWVLDCGACWGDTSLWFAEQATRSGKVFSFEFIPSSLKIFHANLALNPGLSEYIELVMNPVAESSGNTIRCQDNGAASTFKIDQIDDPNACFVEAVTVCIDDWVNSNNLKKVDFIKMDIEGAELDALRGAIETLKRFRPKLAIALYHRPEDIYEIPELLMSLNLGYRYYLKHPTSAGFETVLLALCNSDD